MREIQYFERKEKFLEFRLLFHLKTANWEIKKQTLEEHVIQQIVHQLCEALVDDEGVVRSRLTLLPRLSLFLNQQGVDIRVKCRFVVGTPSLKSVSYDMSRINVVHCCRRRIASDARNCKMLGKFIG